jgi:hypothetical protein
MSKNNIDCTKAENSSLNKFLSVVATPNTNLRDNENQNCSVYQDANDIIFHGAATIPLSQLHNSFEKMPALGSVKGFDLRLQTNYICNDLWRSCKYCNNSNTNFNC